jgi:uncharacterized membrane protein
MRVMKQTMKMGIAVLGIFLPVSLLVSTITIFVFPESTVLRVIINNVAMACVGLITGLLWERFKHKQSISR